MPRTSNEIETETTGRKNSNLKPNDKITVCEFLMTKDLRSVIRVNPVVELFFFYLNSRHTKGDVAMYFSKLE